MAQAQLVEVLYTGGTIGMQQTPQGLAPASGFAALARQAQQQSGQPDVPPWQLTELVPLIDSANMDQSQWWRLARECIRARDAGAQGVVVLHGTDSLGYSAGALAFLLAGLDIPVVITGSMLPVGAAQSDGWENFFDALRHVRLQADAQAPGVYVQFHGHTLHGSSCRKVKSHGRNAFMPAFNSHPLKGSDLPLALMPEAARHPATVATLPLFPGIQAQQLEAMLKGVDGLVLECYGSGTAPSDDDAFFEVLTNAIVRGVMVVAISQCQQGGVVLGTYAAGARLLQSGVVSGGQMTREAALGKLYWLLGSELNAHECRQWLARDIFGELSAADK